MSLVQETSNSHSAPAAAAVVVVVANNQRFSFLVKKEGRKMPDDEEPYWPNCDTSIWMRSCEQEVIEPLEGKSFGKFPDWLKGTLLRNGPGSLKVGEEYRFDHLFDGSALLHRFEIKNGNVTYQRRFIRTDVYKRNQAGKRIVLTEFGTKAVPDPCQSIFQRVSAVFNIEGCTTDNTMISIYPFGDEFYTFTETPFVHRIDPETLETKERLYISKYVGVVNHTSHPHVMNDGTVYNVGMSLTARGPAYNVICFPSSRVKIDKQGEERKLGMFEKAKIVATVYSRWALNPSYMHTFGITDNYFIIIEQPLSVGLVTMAGCRFRNEPMCTSLKWYENENTLIHVISRESGKTVKTFIAEAFFYLHIINQFESNDGKYVVVDICCYKDAKMLDCMYIDVMQNMHKDPDYSKIFRGRPLRFILPMENPKGDNKIRGKMNSFEIPIDYYQNVSIFSEKDDYSNEERRKEDKENETIRLKNLNHRIASAQRLSDGKILVKPELLCDLGCETPRINYQFHLGKEYRYFYAISSDVDLLNPGTLIKVDTVTKTKKTWCEDNVYPSEPIFVPNPNGEREDDGLILSALVWGKGRETEVGILVLDAISFEEIARSTFQTPGPVPKCLHGWFDLKK